MVAATLRNPTTTAMMTGSTVQKLLVTCFLVLVLVGLWTARPSFHGGNTGEVASVGYAEEKTLKFIGGGSPSMHFDATPTSQVMCRAEEGPFKFHHAPNNDDQGTSATRRKVRLLTYVGLEGTGHHMIQSLMRLLAQQNIRRTDSLWNDLNARFVRITEGDKGEHVGLVQGTNQTLPSLDKLATELDDYVDSHPGAHTFGLSHWSNPFSGHLFSGIDPIDLVEITTRSKHDMKLNILVVHRNFTRVIWSTALNRGFASVGKKVTELQNSAIVLNAQLAHIPRCVWRKFDFSDYLSSPQEYQAALAKFFQIDDVSVVARAFELAGASSKIPDTTKYDTLWTPEDLQLIDDYFYRPSVQNLYHHLTDPRYEILTDYSKVGCPQCKWGD